jgi:hypothetical protein
MGHVDGTAAIVGDHGFLFLFNPNYKQLPAEFALDESIGLTSGQKYLLKEIYPFAGRVLGEPGRGAWTRGDRVHLQLDGTSATVFEVVPAPESKQPVLFNAAAVSSANPPRAELTGTSIAATHVAAEPGTTQAIGILLPGETRISALTVNGKAQPFTQSGRYVEAQVRFDGDRFAQAQEIALTGGGDGELAGDFRVPQRIFDQLDARKREWPIPWTQEDYESTWLVPERLLLFVQAADGTDSASVKATIDGTQLKIQPAYSSSRVDSPSFVGFYADLSKIAPAVRHTIKLQMTGLAQSQLQGVFFDNVEPQLTESIAP